jgi:photosystem II stability/assembly factor-like uncharacterized protein
MTRYERVIAILDNAIGGPGSNIGAHGAFWRGLLREQFVAKKVYSEPIIELGNGSGSNLVKALRGEAPFGVDLAKPLPGAKWPRMPFGFAPVRDTDIVFIEGWINEGCPDDQIAPKAMMQWRPTEAPTASSRYDDVWCHDARIGWAVNSNGQILHTQDGGSTWLPQMHEPAGYLRCITFASSQRGWVGSIAGPKVLFETSDGGSTWSPVSGLPEDAPVAVCGIWAANERVVYVAGSNVPEMPVRMMKTTDGGRSWMAWDMRRWADNLIDVYFPTEQRGWVVGGRTDEPRDPAPSKPKLRPVILYTEDGGRTWTDQVEAIRDQFPLGEWGWKIQFLDERRGFISLQNYDAGAILTTGDGGRSWTRRPINDPQMNANLEGIGFIDEQRGWVGGWGDRPKRKRTSSGTSDGGFTWRDANEIGRTINRFRFIGQPVTVGYAAGETIYKYSTQPVAASIEHAHLTGRRGRILQSLEPVDAVGRAEIGIAVPAGASRLTVRIFDPDGPFACLLLDEARPAAGSRVLSWSGVDDEGRPVAARSHIFRVTVDDVSESKLVCVAGQRLK